MSRPVLAFLLALTAIRLLVAAAVPLSPDEAYYWVWSRALAPGYFDHPPAVALLIRAGTALGGDTTLGVRLAAPLQALSGSFLLASAARDLLGLDRVRAGHAALLLNATLLLAAGAVIITPDTPLIFFWTATLAAFGRALRRGPGLWLPVAGICCGVAFCSKYTGVLLVPAIAATILLHRQTRAWLRAPAAWLAAAGALACTAPVLLWNAQHGFASFIKQGSRVADIHPARALQFEFELVAGQVGLFTPLVFAMGVAGLASCARRARQDQPGATLVLLAALVPAAVFVAHAAGGRVQPNWPAIAAPALALAAAAWPPGRVLRAIPAAALGFALAVPLYVQAATGLLPLPSRLDVTLARLGGWRTLGAAVTQGDTSGLPVAADAYGLASELAWTCAAPRVIGAEPRWRFFRLARATPKEAVLLVRSLRRIDTSSLAPAPDGRALAPLARVRNGEVAERYAAIRATLDLPARDTAILPQPARCRRSR